MAMVKWGGFYLNFAWVEWAESLSLPHFSIPPGNWLKMHWKPLTCMRYRLFAFKLNIKIPFWIGFRNRAQRRYSSLGIWSSLCSRDSSLWLPIFSSQGSGLSECSHLLVKLCSLGVGIWILTFPFPSADEDRVWVLQYTTLHLHLFSFLH